MESVWSHHLQGGAPTSYKWDNNPYHITHPIPRIEPIITFPIPPRNKKTRGKSCQINQTYKKTRHICILASSMDHSLSFLKCGYCNSDRLTSYAIKHQLPRAISTFRCYILHPPKTKGWRAPKWWKFGKGGLRLKVWPFKWRCLLVSILDFWGSWMNEWNDSFLSAPPEPSSHQWRAPPDDNEDAPGRWISHFNIA